MLQSAVIRRSIVCFTRTTNAANCGSGIVKDEDGEYTFNMGDFFIFPLGVYHEQRNTGDDVFEAVFIRTK